MAQRATIERAMRERKFVRFVNRYEGGNVRGYVLDIGPSFFLLASVSDHVRLNGFECHRIGDVRNFGIDPHARFAIAALKMRGEKRPKKPRVSVAGIEDILISASNAFPLVTIHRGRVRPDICHIGRVIGVARRQLSLLEIDSDAVWETTPRSYQLSEITRVDFGADYEEALHIVGGNPSDKRRN